jgi:hypothetical protein
MHDTAWEMEAERTLRARAAKSRYDTVTGGERFLEGVAPFSPPAGRMLYGLGGSGSAFGWCLDDLLPQVIHEVQVGQDLEFCPETEKVLTALRTALLAQICRTVRTHGTSSHRPEGYEAPEGFRKYQ